MPVAVAAAAALGSALCYGSASVVQHRAAGQAPPGAGMHLGLLAHLLARPLWLVGLVADAVALALHVVALREGQLTLVQPLLVSGLLFALPVSVALERRRPSLGEWCWALALVAALAAFLAVGHPGADHAHPDTGRLAVLSAAGAAASGLAVLLATRVLSRHRAALLGVAGGIAYGLTAALLKEVTTIGAAHPTRLLAAWSLYALLAIGGAALVLNQAAYQAGPLAASLPSLTMIDPVVSIAAGALVFGEALAHRPPDLVVEVASFAVMTVAVVQLARRSGAPAQAAVDP